MPKSVFSCRSVVLNDMSNMKFGLCISAQYWPDDSPAGRFQEHLTQVQAARAGGFDSIWASHHYLAEPFQMLQPLPVLARLAAEAGQMTIGTAILLIPLLHPVDLAEQDLLSSATRPTVSGRLSATGSTSA